MKKFLLPIILFPATCFSQDVEIHECDGRWTNLPCDQLAPVANTKKVLTPDQARARSQKESMIHDLRMKSIEANREYGVGFDISSAEEICANLDAPLSACRKEVERLDDKLNRRVNSAATLRQREERLRQLEVEAQKPNTTTIVIDNGYPYYGRRRRNYPYIGPGHNGSGTGVINNQTQGFGQQIQQNVIFQQNPPVVVTAAPTAQSSGSSMRTTVGR